jgi:hypothetical protein
MSITCRGTPLEITERHIVIKIPSFSRIKKMERALIEGRE